MLLEAMALGCAVIVTPVGAVPEVVGGDGECAFVIPAGDSAMLADRMTRLAADPELLARMAAAAQERIVERFTERTVTRVLDHAYQLAISTSRAGIRAPATSA
jgi:glycosyltransferase involved in cell wall biosynthesis